MADYSYTVEVTDNGDGSYTATIEAIACVVTAASPILAIKAANEAIVDWAEGGAARWMNGPAGERLARLFVREAL